MNLLLAMHGTEVPQAVSNPKFREFSTSESFPVESSEIHSLQDTEFSTVSAILKRDDWNRSIIRGWALSWLSQPMISDVTTTQYDRQGLSPSMVTLD